MTPDEFRAELERLNLKQTAFASRISVNERTVRRWATGAQPIPHYVRALIQAMEPAS